MPISALKDIRRLRARGNFVLFPLVKDGKKPTESATGWRKARKDTFPDDTLTAGNYAVAIQGDQLVIDVDPRHFKAGDKPLARLVAAVGPLKTFTVRSGAGGLHLYFSKPRDVKTAYTLRAFEGLEFRREGMYVVGPGAVHPDTKKTYDVLVDVPVAPAPEALLNLLKVTEVPFSEIEKDGGGALDFQGDAHTQSRFVEYLASAPLSGSYKIACAGRDFGLPPAITLELMAAHWNPRRPDPRNDAELEAKVIHAYKYARGPVGGKHPALDFDKLKKEPPPPPKEEIVWQLTKNGQVVKCFFNLLNYLKLPGGGLHKVFGYNEFTGQVEFVNPAPWHKGHLPRSGALVQDKDLKLLKGYLAVKHGFEATIGNIEEAMVNVSHDNKFHPVREYLDSIKGTWDKTPRIDTWLQTYAGAADSQYVRAAGRKTLCAAVARILKPGCKFDHVLTLEGPQNAGKSMLCAALGGDWAADFTVDPQAPDTVAAMQGKWIIELAELSVLKKAERNALKAFITRRMDLVRVAYGRLHQEYPRQSIFIGSINPDADNGYLEDTTGNRRWWPVEVGAKIDFKAVARDRNQLFAEARERLENGESIFMDTNNLEEDARAVVASRQTEDPWTERIDAWLHDPIPGLGGLSGRAFVTAREVFIDALGGIDKQIARRDVVRIANVMRRLGWASVLKWKDGRPVRGYSAAPASPTSNKKEDDNELDGLI